MTLSKEEMFLKLGKNIRKLREIKGLSEEGLAKEICMGTEGLCEIEEGSYDLRLLNLLIIKEALGVSIDELFDFE